MRTRRQCRGFSLTEVLLAVGTLAVGMLFIGGTFLVGVHFTTVATEQSIAAVAADEAFAKIRLYGINPDPRATVDPNWSLGLLVPFNEVALRPVDPNEFAYPSSNINNSEKQYHWSALCRRLEPIDPNSRLVEVTVFICRKAGSGAVYPRGHRWPVPMRVSVSGAIGENTLTITEPGKVTWVGDGFTIIDGETGQRYRVLRRGRYEPPEVIVLDRAWMGPSEPNGVWVVPPAIEGNRNPCIAVYQRVMRL